LQATRSGRSGRAARTYAGILSAAVFADIADAVLVGIRLVGIGGIGAIIHFVADPVSVSVRADRRNAAAFTRLILDVLTTQGWIAGIAGADLAVVAVQGRTGEASSAFAADLDPIANILIVAICVVFAGYTSLDRRV